MTLNLLKFILKRNASSKSLITAFYQYNDVNVIFLLILHL